MAKVAASDVRKGMLLAVGDRMCRVTSWNIWKSDRRSRIQMKFKEILTGRTSEVTAQPDDRYDVLDAEKIDLHHSYRDGPDEIFYTETGEEWRFPAAGLEDVLVWVSPIYRGQVVDGKLVAVVLPPTVVATVVKCEPHIKGQSSGLKDATLDNGLTLKVGTMLDVGDRAEFDSETLEFRGRAS
jgi:translation elongation factor P/translation initiation factor 5A